MIGFIGLGDMGVPMASRVVAAGHPLMVWNRTPAKAEPLVAQGARLARSLAELMGKCDLIGLCLTSHQAVGEIAESLFAAAGSERRVLVDFSTGAPEAAVALAERASARGLGWIDAPVSGGVPAAQTGKLTLFLGGANADIAAAAPLLDAVSGRRTVMGGPGAGQAAKVCNQMIVSCSLLVMAETLAAARKAGIDVAQLPDAFRDGFADSAPMRIFGPRMASHAYEPRLGAIALMDKDLGLARTMARAANAPTPIADLCAELYGKAADLSADLARVIEIFEGPDLPG